MNELLSELFPSAFFDLANYSHAHIFDTVQFPWEALPLIPSYLRGLKLGKIEVLIPENVFLIDKHLISIGEGTVLEPGAYIKGPCVIGKNCIVRHGAYIRGDFLAGDSCVIGHDTEVKNSIFFNHTHAAHFAYVGDSILGNRVNLGAGVKCANLKFDKSNIAISYKDQCLPTKLHKLGAICGDDVQLGCNAVTNPGTLIGRGSLCYPCMNFGGVIPPYSKIKTNSRILTSSLNK